MRLPRWHSLCYSRGLLLYVPEEIARHQMQDECVKREFVFVLRKI